MAVYRSSVWGLSNVPRQSSSIQSCWSLWRNVLHLSLSSQVARYIRLAEEALAAGADGGATDVARCVSSETSNVEQL